MSRKMKDRRNRPPADTRVDPFMTISEARAEVVFIALQMLLPKLSETVCRSVMANSQKAGDDWGSDVIREEMDYLFRYVRFDPPVR